MPDQAGTPDPGPPPHPAILAGSRALRRLLIALVRGYQIILGPFLGGQCRFHPSCSNYALIALQTKPAWRALALILWRILRCQPLCKGGFEDVPEHPRDVHYRLK